MKEDIMKLKESEKDRKVPIGTFHMKQMRSVELRKSPAKGLNEKITLSRPHRSQSRQKACKTTKSKEVGTAEVKCPN